MSQSLTGILIDKIVEDDISDSEYEYKVEPKKYQYSDYYKKEDEVDAELLELVRKIKLNCKKN